jgi:predicted O-methyltransferase YrrM
MTKRLTKELITNHPDIAGYLPIGKQVDQTIEGRACGIERLPFLALIADLMREKFPKRFMYLEVGTLFGSSICAIGYHQRQSEIEKYAGIDLFTYYGEKIEPSSGVEVSIERADRNIRYFGRPNSFALFEGDSGDPAIVKRALLYLRGQITLLYIDGDHSEEGTRRDFFTFADRVVPGGVVVFDDYHFNEWPGVTAAVDALDKTGWNVIGGLAPNVPTMFVMQKDEADAE